MLESTISALQNTQYLLEIDYKEIIANGTFEITWESELIQQTEIPASAYKYAKDNIPITGTVILIPTYEAAPASP